MKFLINTGHPARGRGIYSAARCNQRKEENAREMTKREKNGSRADSWPKLPDKPAPRIILFVLVGSFLLGLLILWADAFGKNSGRE